VPEIDQNGNINSLIFSRKTAVDRNRLEFVIRWAVFLISPVEYEGKITQTTRPHAARLTAMG
jgi:hypothetical protein